MVLELYWELPGGDRFDVIVVSAVDACEGLRFCAQRTRGYVVPLMRSWLLFALSLYSWTAGDCVVVGWWGSIWLGGVFGLGDQFVRTLCYTKSIFRVCRLLSSIIRVLSFRNQVPKHSVLVEVFCGILATGISIETH